MSRKNRKKKSHVAQLPNTQIVKSDHLKSEVVSSVPQQGNHILEASMYSGPIPPPVFFAEYEKALPGLADRVMKMSETQTAHRIDLESRVVKTDNIRSILGLLFAFLIVIAGMVIGGYLVYKDKAVAGFAAMFAPLAVVVGSFIYQKVKSKPISEKSEPK